MGVGWPRGLLQVPSEGPLSYRRTFCGSGVLHHTGLASEGSRHGGQSWTEELIAQNAANSGGEEEAPKTLAEEVEYPAVERKLRSWYYHWVSTLLGSCLLAGAVLFADPVKGSNRHSGMEQKLHSGVFSG